MVVKKEWSKNLIVWYIVTMPGQDAKRRPQLVYEVKVEFRNFPYYIQLRLNPNNNQPIQTDMVVSGLNIYRKEVKETILEMWGKVVELASQYQNHKEIMDIKAGRNHVEEFTSIMPVNQYSKLNHGAY